MPIDLGIWSVTSPKDLWINDMVICKYAKADYNGTLSTANIYQRYNWDSTDYARIGIFISSSRVLVAQSAEFNGSSITSWKTIDMPPSSLVAGTDYILALWGDHLAKRIQIGSVYEPMMSKTLVDYSNSGNGDWSLYWNPFNADTGFTKTESQCYEFYLTYDALTAAGYSDYNLFIKFPDGSFIPCNCSRWTVENFSNTIEFVIDKSDAQYLREKITPGAVSELYKILGEPTYIDSTFQNNNTLILEPNPSGSSNLKNMRNKSVCYVKNYSENIISETSHINAKLDCYVSGIRL